MVRACAVCGSPSRRRSFCQLWRRAGPLVRPEERKMVTVLFADLVDSTGLGSDSTRTLTRVWEDFSTPRPMS